MTDRQQVLDLLEDGPLTTDDVAEQSGLERPQAALLLQQLAKEGLARSGRGGWRRVQDPDAPYPLNPPARVIHTAPDPLPAPPPKSATAAPVKRGRRAAAAAQLAATVPTGRAHFIFGMSEAGELLITDAKDTSKTARFSAFDTARLHQVLERWKQMLQPLSEAP